MIHDLSEHDDANRLHPATTTDMYSLLI